MKIARLKIRGYSLLEMIIAASIFAAVSVALAGVFSYHYRAIGSARLFLAGKYLARNKMDECLAAGFDKAPRFNDVGPPPKLSVEFEIGGQKVLTEYTIATTVKPGPSPPGHLTCTVVVSWDETNRVRNVRYSASLSKHS